jgi:hypothetical protein
MRWIIPLVMLVGTACSGQDAPDTAEARLERSDSAGIEIVTVAQSAWQPGEAWTLDPDPILEIGRGGPDDELFRVRGAARLSDGRIAVGNAGTQEIRVYSAAGGFERSFGGAGEGPGEFDSMFGIESVDDTLYAHDFRPARISRFTPEGDLIDDVTLPRQDIGLPIRVLTTPSGFIGMHLGYPENIGESLTYLRRQAQYVRYGRNGDQLGVVDEIPGQEMVMTQRAMPGGGIVSSSTTPLIAHRQWETVVGDRLIAGVTDRFELRVYSESGELERLIRVPAREQPVNEEEWREVQREAVEDRSEATNPEGIVRDLVELAPKPETRPAFAGLVADSEGYVWVRPYRPARDVPTPWLIVSPDGPILGEVELPYGVRPLEIGSDYVLALVYDEMDVPLVRVYGLERGD